MAYNRLTREVERARGSQRELEEPRESQREIERARGSQRELGGDRESMRGWSYSDILYTDRLTDRRMDRAIP